MSYVCLMFVLPPRILLTNVPQAFISCLRKIANIVVHGSLYR